MRKELLIVLSAILIAGCSQDDSNKQEKNVVKVEKKVEKSADKESALICLDDEKGITCKVMTKRVNRERTVIYNWRSPDGKDDRRREMTLPANHASLYDMRDKNGRAKGSWKVTATLEGETVSAAFTVQ